MPIKAQIEKFTAPNRGINLTIPHDADGASSIWWRKILDFRRSINVPSIKSSGCTSQCEIRTFKYIELERSVETLKAKQKELFFFENGKSRIVSFYFDHSCNDEIHWFNSVWSNREERITNDSNIFQTVCSLDLEKYSYLNQSSGFLNHGQTLCLVKLAWALLG